MEELVHLQLPWQQLQVRVERQLEVVVMEVVLVGVFLKLGLLMEAQVQWPDLLLVGALEEVSLRVLEQLLEMELELEEGQED
jgi:hypothetical protein